MAEVYQMLWDCQFCGAQKLLAKTHRACPKCKAPQDPAWRYFPSEADKIEIKNYAFAGNDKVCAACNSLNVATAKFCQSCGAPVYDADVTPIQAVSIGDGAVNQDDLKNHLVLQEQVRITEEALARGSWPEETPDTRSQQLLSRRSSNKSRSLFAYSSPIEKFAFMALAIIGCIIYGPILIAVVLVIVLSLLSM